MSYTEDIGGRHMEPRHVRYFLAVAEERQITRAMSLRLCMAMSSKRGGAPKIFPASAIPLMAFAMRDIDECRVEIPHLTERLAPEWGLFFVDLGLQPARSISAAAFYDVQFV